MEYEEWLRPICGGRAHRLLVKFRQLSPDEDVEIIWVAGPDSEDIFDILDDRASEAVYEAARKWLELR